MSGQAHLHLIDQRELSRSLSAERRVEEGRRKRIDAWLQIAVVVLTMSALWMLTSATPESRYGHVLGLASQPFWIVATWRARQWGMFVVANLMILIWIRGIANTFFV